MELVSFDDVDTQSQVITRLLDFKLGLEAIKWIHYFKLDVQSIPRHIRDKIERSAQTQQRMGNRLEVANVRNEYRLDMPRVELGFVNNAVSFGKMLGVLTSGRLEVLSFDCEWQPTYNEACTLALIQIALPGHVFVIDRLSQEIPVPLWRELGAVMQRTDILKIGFGFEGDAVLLAQQPDLGLSKCIHRDFLDMSHLWDALDSSYKAATKPVAYTQKRGLKDMVTVFLGKVLNKKMQMSNWSMRPLRPEQVIYAAIDAYCLLEIFEEIRARLAKIGADVMVPVEACLSKQRARH